jgi:hypothetical protein
MHAYEMHAYEVHPYNIHAREIHAHKTYIHEIYAHEIHAYEIHAYKVYPNEMHAYEVYPNEMHAREMPARKIRLCARCTPVYVRCTSGRYKSGRCTFGPCEPITCRTYELNKLSSCSIIRITNALVGSFTIWDFGFQEFGILALTSLSSTVEWGELGPDICYRRFQNSAGDAVLEITS